MFSKILIANRGEIACRIMRTARRMGIKTVAVYSDADADALFVDMADEAVLIGPAPAVESYLRIDKIIEAARRTGAEAVHPGYGFLSERAPFAEALAAAGIAFIGPNAMAIAAMGDKIESKKLAAAAGVSSVSGHLGVIANADEAARIAEGIGYPVMVKASAGGGGKGMRIARNEKELREGFGSAANEAQASFGDGRLFVEKFIESPRHIEIQVMGDKHGNVIHLGERECSIQRRNQKVIEEAPSPFLDGATRQAMGEQAVSLARAVGYDSAGTVEFIVDPQRRFYFLEMNTRLQVEHAVTELVTGLDLVELMIRSAAGEKLPVGQANLKLMGSAIEARVYAEDPYRNFLPSIGRLKRYRPPAEGSEEGVTVRNDTGVREGGEISIHYDPMISKLCTHAATRDAAIAAMSRALNEFDLAGIEHNIPFLATIAGHPRFHEGRLSTAFIAEEFPEGFKGATLSNDEISALACVALDAHAKTVERASGNAQGEATPLFVSLAEIEFEVRAERRRDVLAVAFSGSKAGTRTIASTWRPGLIRHDALIHGKPFVTLVEPVLDGWRLRHSGATHIAHVRTARERTLSRLMPAKQGGGSDQFLLCPMPGLVVAIEVAEGQEVKLGEPLAIVEAMKMENVLKAERDGVIKKIHAKKGAPVAVDDVILEFA